VVGDGRRPGVWGSCPAPPVPASVGAWESPLTFVVAVEFDPVLLGVTVGVSANSTLPT